MITLKSTRQPMSRATYYRGTFLSHCSVSPLHPVALQAAQEFQVKQAEDGVAVFDSFRDAGVTFRRAFARLLRTDPENIAFVGSTAAGLNMISNGYPFESGDRILTYSREYGSNYFPWLIAAKRFGVELDLLPDVDPLGELPEEGPRGWSLEDLEQMLTDRTRILALSHVQFASGFAADLAKVGRLCRARGVDLVIDAAQSLGCLPLYPEEMGIAAVAASGWKWLMAPHGSGVFYTSAELRAKLEHAMGGAQMVSGWMNQLDLSWRPYEDARRFEYSTVPWAYLHSLGQVAERVFVPEGIEKIRDAVFCNIDLLVEQLDERKYRSVRFSRENRSGIITLVPRAADPKVLNAEAKRRGLVLVSHGPYLRLAPHFHNTEAEIAGAAELLNGL